VAITRVNSASISGSGTTSAVATIPGGTGILAGDLIVVAANCNGTHVSNGMSVKDSVNGTNFTTIREQDLSAASSRWLQAFSFVTPVNIADGSTITLTAYAASAAAALAVDVFRGVTGTISNAATGTSPAAGATSLGPALGAAPAAGNLVLSFNSFAANTATLTVASPFTRGSAKLASTPSAAIGYVLSADGSSTYAVTWTNDSSQSNADVTVAFTAAASAAAAPAPLMRPVMGRRAPLRARLGRLGLCAAGIASTIVTPLGTQQPHKPPVPVTRPAPHRAHAGPLGACGAGTAGPQPSAVLVTTAYQRPSPQISRRLPQRAIWRGLASQVVTPRGSPASPLPRPVIQHLPPERARTGPAGRPWGGTASAVVTPLGSLQAPRRAVIAPPRNARARLGPASGCGDGNIGPSATVPAAAQAYQRPGPQVRRPVPARARLGPAGSTGDGVTGPANAQPAAAVSPPRLPPQTRRPAPARAQWRGNASQIITPLGTPPRRPGPQITSRPRTRALWRGISGTIAPPVTALPKWRPLPSRRKPQRARTGGVLGLANALPPPFTVGALTASGAPAAVLTAAGASSALTAATAPSGTLTAATAAGNALELFPVQAEDLGELFDEAGGQIGA
jgi:hypothetical protein